MKTVRDIMSPVVFCLEDNQFLPEAAQALRNHSISGAPVLNAAKQYVGVLSQTDINAKVASVIDDVGRLRDVLEGGFPPDIESIRVRDIMTPEILKISSEASLEELGQALLVGGVHRLLVSQDNEVIGLVSTTDLIHGFLSPEGDDAREPKRPSPKPYLFETELTLDNGVARLKGPYGAEIDLEPPPEFGGTGRYSSPEDLFVGSINACLSLTFHEFAKRANVKVYSYTCRAIGRLEGDGVSQRFTRVDLYPKIRVEGSAERAEKILMQAKLRCLVGRSSDVIAVLHPKIESQPFQEI
jgi:CBS domain-containing protein/organic hydroperoxide reductase OsmC/OhrA